MKTLFRLFILLLFICILFDAVYGDYLEVRRSANIKREPNGDAVNIEKVEPGTNLPLLNDGHQTNGYYSVRTISQGLSGWIYRTLVRRHPGDIPQQVPEAGWLTPLQIRLRV